MAIEMVLPLSRSNKLSPMHLNWALVHYFSADPANELGREHYHSEAGREVQDWLKREGLYEGGRGTARLAAFVDHLCNQKLPVQVWVQPEEADGQE